MKQANSHVEMSSESKTIKELVLAQDYAISETKSHPEQTLHRERTNMTNRYDRPSIADGTPQGRNEQVANLQPAGTGDSALVKNNQNERVKNNGFNYAAAQHDDHPSRTASIQNLQHNSPQTNKQLTKAA
jgi:hypothetical protein